MDKTTVVSIKNLHKSFEDVEVLKGINMEIKKVKLLQF